MRSRPVLGIVAGAPTPYRIHLHGRLARELDVELHCVYLGRGRRFSAVPHPPNTNPHFAAEAGRRGWLRSWRKGGEILAHLRAAGADAVIVNGYSDLTRMRVIASFPPEVPVFVRGDSNILGDRASGFRGVVKRFVLSRLLRRASGALVMGALGEEYFERYGASRTFLVPVEPDYSFFSVEPTVDEAADLAERFELTTDRNYVVFCGTVDDNKRVSLLIDAYGRALGDRTDWGLLIVGDGPRRAGLESQTSSPAVTWLGFQEGTSLRATYSLSAVLVLPSDREAWGLVVNEAMAAGLAVICSSQVGAAPELVEGRGAGRVFTAGDVDSLVAALIELTEPATLAAAREQAPLVVDQWRSRADPVAGVRAALVSVGIDV